MNHSIEAEFMGMGDQCGRVGGSWEGMGLLGTEKYFRQHNRDHVPGIDSIYN